MKKTFSIVFVLAALFGAVDLYAQYCGEFNAVTGVVEVEKSGSTQWAAVLKGLPVESGDRVRTANHSSCEVAIDDGSYLFIGEKTEATVDHMDAGSGKLEAHVSLWLGKLIAHIEKFRTTKMTVKTPVSVASVRGTEFAVDTEKNESQVGVFEGKVQVNNAVADETSDEGSVAVEPDQQTTVAKDQHPAAPTRLSELMKKNKERLDGLRDRIKQRKEKLKRTPPDQLQAQRARILERYQKLRTQLDHERDSIKKRNAQLKQEVFYENEQK
ncbi:MAG: FecR family protein [Endomicrobiales bacterium]|jgi:hypothetical protein